MQNFLYLFALLAMSAACLWWAKRSGASRASGLMVAPSAQQPTAPQEASIAPYATPAIEEVRDECFKLAFGVQQFDYVLLDEHAHVFETAAAKLRTFTPAQDYFPRRPMLLPKLLQTLNSEDTTRAVLTQMVMQDAALAGAVLERANTAWYRTTPKPVESIDRALAMLGSEGLRSILAVFILQPLFRLPSGYFDRFAAITWEQGQRAGHVGKVLAQRTGSGDPLVAQLLALLSALSRIVLFRFTSDCYREAPDSLPRAEVFIRLMRQHGAELCVTIANEWDLSAASIAALQEQAQLQSPALMSPLGRTVYFAELCGALAIAHGAGKHSEAGARSILREQGMTEYDMAAAWHTARHESSRG